jgi:hypothetical protein
MLKAVYVKYRGELYEIVADIFGEVTSVVVYADNSNKIGRKIELDHIPPAVMEEVQNKITKWYNI